jgi:hypothetical protein
LFASTLSKACAANVLPVSSRKRRNQEPSKKISLHGRTLISTTMPGTETGWSLRDEAAMIAQAFDWCELGSNTWEA